MGRYEKLKERFLSRPKDFTWDELCRFLKSFGYEKKNGSGSRRVFEGDGLPRIRLHEPHPQNVVKRIYLDEVKKKLEDEGLL